MVPQVNSERPANCFNISLSQRTSLQIVNLSGALFKFFASYHPIRIIFQVRYSEINSENTMSYLYFNEENDYSEENTI